jgi:hypothetical protein
MKLFEELVVYPAIPFIAFGFILHLLVICTTLFGQRWSNPAKQLHIQQLCIIWFILTDCHRIWLLWLHFAFYSQHCVGHFVPPVCFVLGLNPKPSWIGMYNNIGSDKPIIGHEQVRDYSWLYSSSRLYSILWMNIICKFSNNEVSKIQVNIKLFRLLFEFHICYVPKTIGALYMSCDLDFFQFWNVLTTTFIRDFLTAVPVPLKIS